MAVPRTIYDRRGNAVPAEAVHGGAGRSGAAAGGAAVAIGASPGPTWRSSQRCGTAGRPLRRCRSGWQSPGRYTIDAATLYLQKPFTAAQVEAVLRQAEQQ